MRQSFVAPSYHRIVLGLSMLVVVFVHVFLDRITRIYFHSWRWVHTVLDLSWILTVSIHFGFLVYLPVYFGSNCCWDEIRFDRGFQTSTTDISLPIINPSILSYVIQHHLISLKSWSDWEASKSFYFIFFGMFWFVDYSGFFVSYDRPRLGLTTVLDLVSCSMSFLGQISILRDLLCSLARCILTFSPEANMWNALPSSIALGNSFLIIYSMIRASDIRHLPMYSTFSDWLVSSMWCVIGRMLVNWLIRFCPTFFSAMSASLYFSSFVV